MLCAMDEFNRNDELYINLCFLDFQSASPHLFSKALFAAIGSLFTGVVVPLDLDS